MAAYITVLNYVYSLCVFYYSVLSYVADVADCPLQRFSAIVIKNIIAYDHIESPKGSRCDLALSITIGFPLHVKP